nr:immunoglobulin light chain junction region [Mus musculus]
CQHHYGTPRTFGS